MSRLLDQAIDQARGLPEDAQDDLARFILAISSDLAEPPLGVEEAEAITEAEAEIARGEGVAPGVVDAFWRSHGV